MAKTMGYSTDDSTGGQKEMQVLRASRAASRSDLFPKLVSMQKLVGARNFAVFRAVASGFPNKRKLVCELENWGVSAREASTSLLETLGQPLLDHIESSLLPLMWNGTGETGIAEAPDTAALVRRLENGFLPYAGLAFPVRLGTIGNGFVVFCSGSIDVDSETIVEQHLKSCQIMIDLLALDERRSAPAEALSEREIACLQLAGDGRISEEIAVKLGLSVHTVNAYLGSATIKLDSVNRIQAIAKAIRLGYIH
jgi:DNA-binding CsgD family transcriptional regulator